MNPNPSLPPTRAVRYLWALLLYLVSASAQALNWQVDLLIFRHLESDSEVGHPPQVSTLGHNAISLGDATALQSAGITLLPESQFGLQEKWGHLRRSRQFRPLVKLSWIQRNPPARGGPRLRIQSGEKILIREAGGLQAQELFEIDGTVRLNLGRYLHIDAQLVYTRADGNPLSWTLSEDRRMRSNELHHLDSAKLGAIVQVRRIATGGP